MKGRRWGEEEGRCRKGCGRGGETNAYALFKRVWGCEAAKTIVGACISTPFALLKRGKPYRCAVKGLPSTREAAKKSMSRV